MPLPKISIVIPVYNVEKYISDCLESVLKQTFGDFEVIAVDDGSTDVSGRILDEFAAKDSRVVPVHKPNAGVAAARNTGIEKARGEWIYFIDSDDMISEDYLEGLYHTAVASGCDVAAGRKTLYYWGENDKRNYEVVCKQTGTAEITAAAVAKRITQVVVWNKIFRRDFIEKHHIRFPEGVWYEDNYFYYVAMANINRLPLSDAGGYFYRQREGSIMYCTRREMKNDNHVDVFLKILDYYKQNNLLNKAYLPVSMLKSQLDFSFDKKAKFKEIRRVIAEHGLDKLNLSRRDARFVRIVTKHSFVFYMLRYWLNKLRGK